jgi:hypothetical protein
MRTCILLFSLLTLGCARTETTTTFTRTETIVASTEDDYLNTAIEVCGEVQPMCRRNACVLDIVNWLANEQAIGPVNIQGGI